MNDAREKFANALATAAELEPDDREAIAAVPIVAQGVRSSSLLIRERDQITTLWLPVTGLLCREHVVRDGGRQILDIALPGEICDPLQIHGTTACHSVRALADSLVLAIPMTEVRALAAARPAIGQALAALAERSGAMLAQLAINLGRRDALARVAHKLCDIAVRLGSKDQPALTIEIPLTQEHMGDLLGLTSVHVNRMIRTLRARGAIEGSSRATKIADWDQLVKLGEFSPTYLG